MSWKEERREARFRDVPFYYRSAGATTGRRNAVHEFPWRDGIYAEDLGRRKRDFAVEAFVIGDNYLAWRNNLEAACEKPGPGELIHPTRGRLQVIVLECRAHEEIERQGMAGFSITFLEVEDRPSSIVRLDTRAVVELACPSVLTAASKSFDDSLAVNDQPPFVEEDILDSIASFLDDLNGLANSLTPDMSLLPALTAAARDIAGQVTSLLRIPTSLAAKLSDQISALRLVALDPLMAWQALLGLCAFDSCAGSINGTTPARVAQAGNRSALQNLVRQTAIVEAARTATTIDYPSRDEALAARDQLVAVIDAEMATADDAVFVALADLKVAVVSDFAERGILLPRLAEYTPAATVPAIVLAHRLYGDPERDGEIVARNRIRHPGFVPGGEPLEVLQ